MTDQSSKQMALDQELIRQKLEDYEESLKEKDKLIQLLEKGQQDLEDQLEDANTEIDRLRQELAKYRLEITNGERIRRELENRCKKLEQKLYQVGFDGSITMLPEVDGLRDMRMQPPKSKVVSFFSAMTLPFLQGLLGGLLLGSGALLLLLEILSFMYNNQELFSYLLN